MQRKREIRQAKTSHNRNLQKGEGNNNKYFFKHVKLESQKLAMVQEKQEIRSEQKNNEYFASVVSEEKLGDLPVPKVIFIWTWHWIWLMFKCQQKKLRNK